jgi:hypothetical protein
MAISKEDARLWAERLIQIHNDEYEYSFVYEDEELVEEFPDEADQIAILDAMYEANLKVEWDD